MPQNWATASFQRRRSRANVARTRCGRGAHVYPLNEQDPESPGPAQESIVVRSYRPNGDQRHPQSPNLTIKARDLADLVRRDRLARLEHDADPLVSAVAAAAGVLCNRLDALLDALDERRER